MGVIFDYFRAPSGDEARRAAKVRGGPVRAFDGVETKWIDPCVVLGQLVGFVRGVSWSVDLVSTTQVWPRPNKDTEQCVLELGVEVRDVLARVDDLKVSELAERWARIEEFEHFTDIDADWMGSLIRDLVGLARRAREADEQLYCFVSL